MNNPSAIADGTDLSSQSAEKIRMEIGRFELSRT
jgi:hypothetical protein